MFPAGCRDYPIVWNLVSQWEHMKCDSEGSGVGLGKILKEEGGGGGGGKKGMSS